MVVGSLFSGAGLLDAGLHQAGIRHGWFVERDEFRRGLLARRWPGVPVHDDVRTAGAATLARVDGIVGGFPCKGASSAGKRTGLAHPETALWSEFERIVRELRPRFVLVENVAAILSLHGGDVWGTVLGDLASLGYDVAWDCIPASAVGAPHGRDRVFAVARHAESASGEGARPEREALGRVGAADHGAAADPARLREGGPGPQAGADRERARPGADAAADTDGADGERDADQRRVAGGRSDAGGGGQATADAARSGREACGSDGLRALPRPDAGRPARSPGPGVAVEWGDYEPAVRRWEAIHGPAPEPLLRRMDDGDAKLRRMRSRVDRSRLSALGDGVHVYVGRLLGEALMVLDSKEAA
jgi:DNA (cytosine-5)-methyltransferase 1